MHKIHFFTGFMFDAYNSYNEGLILMGAFIAMSGLMLYPIPCIRQALEKVKGSSFCCICSYFSFSLISDSQEGSQNVPPNKA